MTTPESVSTDPSELVVVHVVVYSVPAIDFGNSEVVVKNEPAELVLMITIPESVSTDPSELVVVHVVV
ncbi:CIC11C00000002186 [Sungouiella intermedia]|uniref:CIC11C00000002186 n=1 Tax=Sungouiella intermedia TaxID=45354 RepID=A0A1L0G8X5_9ASCO|nr:CIC11C00000002186 [[Candida] intermedia]